MDFIVLVPVFVLEDFLHLPAPKNSAPLSFGPTPETGRFLLGEELPPTDLGTDELEFFIVFVFVCEGDASSPRNLRFSAVPVYHTFESGNRLRDDQKKFQVEKQS